MLRGLSANPANRHASLEALLKALERPLVRRRQAGAWAATGAIALVATTIAAWRVHHAPACRGVSAEMASAWGRDATPR